MINGRHRSICFLIPRPVFQFPGPESSSSAWIGNKLSMVRVCRPLKAFYWKRRKRFWGTLRRSPLDKEHDRFKPFLCVRRDSLCSLCSFLVNIGYPKKSECAHRFIVLSQRVRQPSWVSQRRRKKWSLFFRSSLLKSRRISTRFWRNSNIIDQNRGLGEHILARFKNHSWPKCLYNGLFWPVIKFIVGQNWLIVYICMKQSELWVS